MLAFDTERDAFLNWVTQGGSRYLVACSGDPGDDGTAVANEIAAVGRQSITWPVASGGASAVTNTNAVPLDNSGGVSDWVITWVVMSDSATVNGSGRYKFQLPQAKTVPAGTSAEFAVGELSFAHINA